jgi:hypothetical protein
MRVARVVLHCAWGAGSHVGNAKGDFRGARTHFTSSGLKHLLFATRDKGPLRNTVLDEPRNRADSLHYY